MEENSMSEERIIDKTVQEEIASAKEARRQEIAQVFDPNRMKVIRKELFANLRDPAVTIRNGSITFNTASALSNEGHSSAPVWSPY